MKAYATNRGAGEAQKKKWNKAGTTTISSVAQQTK